MNPNSAAALKTACTNVLAALDGWEGVDVRTLDIDDALRRFQNKRGREFKPATVRAYQQRFRFAVEEFLRYVADPSSWRSPSRVAATRKEPRRPSAKEISPRTSDFTSTGPEAAAEWLDYPFPLREGRIARLRLPPDLKVAEARRLSAYLMALAVDSNIEENDSDVHNRVKT